MTLYYIVKLPIKSLEKSPEDYLSGKNETF